MKFRYVVARHGRHFELAESRTDMTGDKPLYLNLGGCCVSFPDVLSKITVQQVVHRRGTADSLSLGRRVLAVGRAVKHAFGNGACLIHRELAVGADRVPAGTAFLVPVLDEIGSVAARH